MAFAAVSDDAWRPPVAIDLATARPKAVEAAVNDLKAHLAKEPLPATAISAGWYTVTPQIALDWFARNRGNRQVQLAVLQKYANSMLAGRWRRTGQPIVFDVNGKLIEGQHRLLASVFSGASFDTFVVVGASDERDIFAYIDNGKPRSAADALFTNGSNGSSDVLAAAVKIAIRFDAGGFRVSGMPKMPQVEPFQVMDYVDRNPSLRDSVHRASATFRSAFKIIGHAGAAHFFAWQVTERYGMTELQHFLSPLGSGANLPENSPILALRDRLREVGDDQKGKLPLNHRLGLLIKAFGIHYRGETILLKAPPRKKGQAPQQEGLFLADNEEFPQFPPVEESTAEAAD